MDSVVLVVGIIVLLGYGVAFDLQLTEIRCRLTLLEKRQAGG